MAIFGSSSCYRYFNRDVECIKTFLRRRFRYESALYPKFKRTLANEEGGENFKLDVVVAASGFSRKDMKVLAVKFFDNIR